MSIPRRLLRIAVDKLKDGIDLDDWAPRSRARGQDARGELEDYLRDPVHAAPPRPTAPPSDPLAAEYAVLGLAPGAGAEAVRRAWVRGARDNHPDRFAGDPAAQSAAAERFLRIQQAYEKITAAHR